MPSARMCQACRLFRNPVTGGEFRNGLGEGLQKGSAPRLRHHPQSSSPSCEAASTPEREFATRISSDETGSRPPRGGGRRTAGPPTDCRLHQLRGRAPLLWRGVDRGGPKPEAVAEPVGLGTPPVAERGRRAGPARPRAGTASLWLTNPAIPDRRERERTLPPLYPFSTGWVVCATRREGVPGWRGAHG